MLLFMPPFGTEPVLVKLIGVKLHAASQVKSATGDSSNTIVFVITLSQPNSEVAVSITVLDPGVANANIGAFDLEIPSDAKSHL